MKELILVSLLAAGWVHAAAQSPAEPAPAVSSAPVVSPAPAEGSYDYGMLQRRRGEYAAARETFKKLLEKNPDSGGALEGLALSCLSLGQYGEAREALERWNSQAPGSLYVLGLLARARSAQKDEKAALAAYREIVKLSPSDCAARGKVENLSRSEPGVFPLGRAYRSRSIEGLDTASPQRIVYDGFSAGARFRSGLGAGLDLIGGAELRGEAQRNSGRGFTYFDLREQAYSAGLAGLAGKDLYWEGEYGQSVFTDTEDTSARPLAISRGRVSLRRGAAGLDLQTLPKLVRVSGGGRFYRLLRENSVRADYSAGLLGWDWLGRAGFSNISGGRTLGSLGLRGSRDYSAGTVYSGYAHGQQEFYSASAAGRLRYVHTDRLSAAFSRGAAGKYRAGASLAETFYSDANRLFEAGGDLTGWLPWQPDFSGGYRYAYKDFRGVRSGYDSIDETGHWLGAYWRRCGARNWSAALGYEHGFLRDTQVSYQANHYTAEAEWASGPYSSLKVYGANKSTTARGRSWSAGLQARLNFK